MKTVTINLYSFNELNEAAQRKAIVEHKYFLDSTDNMEYSKNETIENIEANKYLFYFDGELAHCTTYTDGHPKTGITEFHFHKQTFTL